MMEVHYGSVIAVLIDFSDRCVRCRNELNVDRVVTCTHCWFTIVALARLASLSQRSEATFNAGKHPCQLLNHNYRYMTRTAVTTPKDQLEEMSGKRDAHPFHLCSVS